MLSNFDIVMYYIVFIVLIIGAVYSFIFDFIIIAIFLGISNILWIVVFPIYMGLKLDFEDFCEKTNSEAKNV